MNTVAHLVDGPHVGSRWLLPQPLAVLNVPSSGPIYLYHLDLPSPMRSQYRRDLWPTHQDEDGMHFTYRWRGDQ